MHCLGHNFIISIFIMIIVKSLYRRDRVAYNTPNIHFSLFNSQTPILENQIQNGGAIFDEMGEYVEELSSIDRIVKMSKSTEMVTEWLNMVLVKVQHQIYFHYCQNTMFSTPELRFNTSLILLKPVLTRPGLAMDQTSPVWGLQFDLDNDPKYRIVLDFMLCIQRRRAFPFT